MFYKVVIYRMKNEEFTPLFIVKHIMICKINAHGVTLILHILFTNIIYAH